MAHKKSRDIEEKRKKMRLKAQSPHRNNRKRKWIIFAIVVFIFLFVGMSAKNIIELSLEQSKLKAQQKELTAERDELKAKLKNIDTPEYTQDEARKKLRLVLPDEILFIFKDDKDSSQEGK
ncbi:MAG: hypothetical protein GX852_06545 [Clostridiales bacterium]|jgi:cell division protein DivIC|nr:hypothetical protein [Clostridiales bacterium]